MFGDPNNKVMDGWPTVVCWVLLVGFIIFILML
jgi:hypothetical protein